MRFPVRLWNSKVSVTGVTVDLSDVGLLVSGVPTELFTGMRFHVELSLPEGLVFAEGQIVRQSIDAGGVPVVSLRLLRLLECIPGGSVTRER